MIVATINQKGGVGKSTTAHEMGADLTRRGYKVLYIDLDPQGSLTYIAGGSAAGPGAMELLQRKAPAADVIKTTRSGANIIHGGADLTAADLQLSFTGKEYRLREALEPIKKDFDFIIVDAPPALGILTINALTAADYIIIPAQADILSLQGIGQLNDTLRAVREYCNPLLRISGILLTRYTARNVISRDLREVIADTAQAIGADVFKTTIRDTVTIKEAQAERSSVFTYAPRSKAAADYSDFTSEFLQRTGSPGKRK